MTSVQVVGLEKSFGQHTVVGGVDVSVAEGEVVSLLGPSGCGKTTTLRCIAGLERPDRGRISIGDRTVVDADARIFVPPNRRNVGMMFQSYALWPHMSVLGNVAYPLRVRRMPKADVRARVAEVLKVVGLHAEIHRSVTALSGGQQQRVALARALVAAPSVVLFDEPLSNLDAKLRVELRKELRALHAKTGVTAVYVTHDQEEAMLLSDRVVVMGAGCVQQTGSPRDVYRNPINRFVAEFVGFENFVSGTVTAVRGSTASIVADATSTTIRGMAGASVAPGSRAIAAVRARDVRVEPDSSLEEDGTLKGRVESCSFLGDDIEVALRCGQTMITARCADRPNEDGVTLEAGVDVAVRLDVEKVVVLPDVVTGPSGADHLGVSARTQASSAPDEAPAGTPLPGR